MLAFTHARPLVDAGTGVGAHELAQAVGMDLTLLVQNIDAARSHRNHFATGTAENDLARAHQRTVHIVMFQEGDERARHAHRLLRRYVHVVEVIGTLQEELALVASQDAVLHELVDLRKLRVGLRDPEVLLVISAVMHHLMTDEGLYTDLGTAKRPGKPVEERLLDTYAHTFSEEEFSIRRLDILTFAPEHTAQLTTEQAPVIGWQALVDLAVGRLNETIGIDARIGCKVADQADILTIGRFDWANAAIV